jgi:hypothetical protein
MLSYIRIIVSDLQRQECAVLGVVVCLSESQGGGKGRVAAELFRCMASESSNLEGYRCCFSAGLLYPCLRTQLHRT